jgi:cytochrome c551/c552
MRSQAIVMTAADYTRWYKGSTAPTGGAGGAAAAMHTFNSNGCAACHTLSAIPGAVGKVGPSLDNLKAQAAASHLSLVAYITRAIVTPYAHIPKGYAAGVMPATFGTTIPKTQLAALVQYLAAHTH